MGKKFNDLDRKIDKEYRSKGFSQEQAAHIAAATAGKVYREKLAKAERLSKRRARKRR